MAVSPKLVQQIFEPGTAGANPPAFGAFWYKAKDQYYLLRSGFIYTSPRIVTKATTRFSASILLTADRRPFEVVIDGQVRSVRAIVIRPLLERGLRAEDVQLVSIQVNPYHPLFRRFRAIPNPGAIEFDRDIFSEFDEALIDAYIGKLDIEDAPSLLEGIVAKTAQYLPKVRPIRRPDQRVQRAIEILRENPNYPLKKLAATLNLSYDRMSHLFAETIGLPLRSYLLWTKFRAATLLRGSGLSLTQIARAAGFSNTAHLSCTWQQAFGHTPSQFFFESDFMEIRYGVPQKHDTAVLEAARPAAHLVAETGRVRQASPTICEHCGSVLSPAPKTGSRVRRAGAKRKTRR